MHWMKHSTVSSSAARRRCARIQAGVFNPRFCVGVRRRLYRTPKVCKKVYLPGQIYRVRWERIIRMCAVHPDVRTHPIVHPDGTNIHNHFDE